MFPRGHPSPRSAVFRSALPFQVTATGAERDQEDSVPAIGVPVPVIAGFDPEMLDLSDLLTSITTRIRSASTQVKRVQLA
jgi:hypothetical protein